MLSKWKTLILILLCVSLVSAAGLYCYSQGYKAANKNWTLKWTQRDLKEAQLKQRQSEIADRERNQRLQDVAALDAKYTGELSNAKKRIEDLQRDVANGTKRLFLNGRSLSLSCPTAAAGMDDVTRPELDGPAQRNYFILREQIEIARKQIAGLQEYIRQQCIKE